MGQAAFSRQSALLSAVINSYDPVCLSVCLSVYRIVVYSFRQEDLRV